MELHEITDKALDYMMPELETLVHIGDPKLSAWEKEQFLPSVIEQWTRRRKLSDKQKEIIGRIWDKL